MADRLHPLWDRWPTQHPEHSPFGGSPPRRPKTTKPHSCGVQHRVPVKLQESFGSQSWHPGNFHPTIFTCPKYFWAKTWAISLFDPRSIPEAFHFRCKAPVISLNQARAVGRGSCIASTTLASPTAKLRQVMMHLGLDTKNVQKIMDGRVSIQQESIGK